LEKLAYFAEPMFPTSPDVALSIAWQEYLYYISLTGTLFCGQAETNRAPLGVGLIIGKIGQMPGASCFWGPRA